MSFAAYKILKIVKVSEPSFDVLVMFEVIQPYIKGSFCGNGLLELDIDAMKSDLADGKIENNEEADFLRSIIEESDDKNYIQYYCV